MSELEQGKNIEREHKGTIKKIKKNPKIKAEKAYTMIAKDHIKEDPKYYTKLKKYVESNDPDVEAKSRKTAYDSIPGKEGVDKVKWETFKRLYASLDPEKAKKKAVLAKKTKNESKNIPSEFLIFAECYLDTLNESKSNKIEKTTVSRLLNKYIKQYDDSIDDLLAQADSGNLDFTKGDKEHLLSTKLAETDKTIHKKASIISKTTQVANRAIELKDKLQKEFQNYSKAIKSKKADVGKITDNLSVKLAQILGQWNNEMSMRDVTGHLTQPSKMVLIDLLNKKGINVPVKYGGVGNTPDFETAVRANKINPEYPLYMLLNIVAFQALNDILPKVDPSLRDEVAFKIANSIWSVRGVKTRLVDYINTSKLKDELRNVDFKRIESLNRKEARKKASMRDTTLGDPVRGDYRSLTSDIDREPDEVENEFGGYEGETSFENPMAEILGYGPEDEYGDYKEEEEDDDDW
jgi:hypothetical protein